MSKTTSKLGVLFVCTGNICRSPTAEGVFRAKAEAAGLLDQLEVDSAGTHDYHPGSRPDERSAAEAARRGYDLSRIRARAVVDRDFERFDYVLAMDRGNQVDLHRRCPDTHRTRVQMFLTFAPELGVREVPDPYYGDGQGFTHVLDLVEVACDGLLTDIRQRLKEQR